MFSGVTFDGHVTVAQQNFESTIRSYGTNVLLVQIETDADGAGVIFDHFRDDWTGEFVISIESDDDPGPIDVKGEIEAFAIDLPASKEKSRGFVQINAVTLKGIK